MFDWLITIILWLLSLIPQAQPEPVTTTTTEPRAEIGSALYCERIQDQVHCTETFEDGTVVTWVEGA